MEYLPTIQSIKVELILLFLIFIYFNLLIKNPFNRFCNRFFSIHYLENQVL